MRLSFKIKNRSNNNNPNPHPAARAAGNIHLCRRNFRSNSPHIKKNK